MTHKTATYHIYPGEPLPFGATLQGEGINFAIYSRHATGCALVLYQRGARQPFAEIPVPADYRIGDVFAIGIRGLDHKAIEYGYRLEGTTILGDGTEIDPATILLDPYAKAVSGRETWGQLPDWDNPFQHRALIIESHFDWGADRPLRTPIEDLVIYEMHVRGFTRHPSAGATHPGTYDAIREKIHYLKELGVNCVELMPVFEFDEFENSRKCPDSNELLLNYWGYAPVAFFAPKAGYAASKAPDGPLNELKALIRDLHANGIEVILDVVFNHTAEGNEKGPVISFKGIDNDLYYILTPEGYYYNFSGTGNTFNCNHPRVRGLILDCLRYWVTEYHVDGFRFDLASVMTRDLDGTPLADPPLLRAMVDDPILSGTKLIAEPWDADGLYHLGSFPAHGRWAEWNGQYRDTLRRFLKGDAGQVRAMAEALTGSPQLYPGRGPIATINFITAHDGFTLMDLVSYNQKHNAANCEPGDSGTNANYSWNCGVEGPTDDAEINALRHRQIKNALAMLLMSQGVPMLLMGDEMGRTQHGNNNAYCQDTPLSWMDWAFIQKNFDIFEFFKACVAFRHRHPALRNGYFLREEDYAGKGCIDLTWHGVRVGKPDFSGASRTLAFMLCGAYAKGGLATDDNIYMAMNMHWKGHHFELPSLPEGQSWHVFINTGRPKAEVHFPDTEPRLDNQQSIVVRARSVVILVGR